MKFIIVDNRSGKHRSFTANGFLIGLTVAGMIGIPSAAGYFSYRHGIGEAGLTGEMVGKWREVLVAQGSDIQSAQRNARESLEASAVRLAKLQARIVRIDALGERLTTVAKLKEGEFDLSRSPGLGGPEELYEGAAYTPPNFLQVLNQLGKDIESRQQQLGILETLLVNRKLQSDVFLAGRPVKKGWMSSRFGPRNDPINGKRAWHNGVDFAGSEGDDVVTVAAGVVVYAGSRNGYGKMVEVNHGGGFISRYGHHKEIVVKVGDIVKKNQVIGLMGSSGRATGPHVHFEVFKHGRAVDPSSYIHRASR
jgi:murein DD-endopeptidase MepM/ murein hydrolase activator NlpD